MSMPESVQEPHRRLRWLLVVVGLCLWLPLEAAQPAKGKMSAAERQAKLKERDKFAALTTTLRREGKLSEAIQAAEKMLAIEREVFGNCHEDVAGSLQQLAEMHEHLEHFPAARKARQEELEITTRLYGENDWRATDARLALADLERRQSLTAEQRQRLTKANQLNARLIALYSKGKYREALPLGQQVLDIRKQVLGGKHHDYATSLDNLAVVYLHIGDYAKAGPLHCQALDIRKQVLGEKHPSYAISLNNLAAVYRGTGDYDKAEPLFHQALDIIKRVLSDKHPRYATSLNNLAGLYCCMGDYAKAEPLVRQASEIWKQTLGDKHPDYAQSLIILADLYDRMSDYAKAEPLVRQASEIWKQTLGDKHPYYALSLANLALLHMEMGDYDTAEPLQRQALQIRKQVLGEKHPAYTADLHNLAWLYQKMGDYAKAEPLYRHALGIDKQALGEKHPYYATSLNNLALLYLTKNEGARSQILARQAWQIMRKHLEVTANAQSERQQLRMNASLRRYLDNFLSAAAAAKSPADEVYAEVLIAKGAVSLRQQRMRQLRHELVNRDPQTASLFADLEAATRRLAALINTTPTTKQLEKYRERLDDANAEVERLQKQLAAVSAAFRKELKRRQRTPDDLGRSLPDGVALVDLLEYGHFTPQAKGHGRWERRLAAFVVRKDRPVVWLDLGPVESLAKTVEQWRATIRRPTRPAFGDKGPAVTLRKRLWEPLEPHLKDAATVLLSPDGVVARLPWGALPGAAPDKYLLEERNIAVLPVPQFLPELLAAAKAADEHSSSLLVVGDVDYEAAAGKADVEIASRGLATVLQRGGGASWKRLPGTKKEAAAIRALYRRCFPTGTTKLLEAGTATEGAVREAGPHYAWLHLATHGYFAPLRVNAALRRDKQRLQSRMSLADQRGFVGFPEGLLAGVVLAGANNGGGADEDDGVLTALEVAELDLRGVELAVLSACETGLGAKAGGEGLLGLQRAFQVAGAHSVAASLWSVPDEATRVLMERFYDNLWHKKMGRLASLREAQLWLLRQGQRQPELRRGLDLVRDEPADAAAKRLPPYYWAAFVLSGDWR